jgi:metallo-beta-lactamase class B
MARLIVTLPLNVVYSGGAALVYEYTNPEWGIKNMTTYINSQRHLAAKAKETGATVLLSNHSEFDEAVKKNRMLAGRGNGPHPYEIGADWVQRYFKVTENCARATQLKLEQLSGQSR